MHPLSRRTPNILNRALAVAGAVLLVFVLAGIPLYVVPRSDEAKPTDVIFLLGPVTPTDIALAESMIAQGLSRNLLVSVDISDYWQPEQRLLCDSPQTFEVTCATPTPFTTQGEARMLQTQAEQNGWRSATVITQTTHVTRSRLIIARCFVGDLRVTADGAPASLARWAQQYLYQSGAFLKAFLITDGC